MEPVLFDQRPEMERPVVVMAFSGWNDAGESASTAADALTNTWGALPFGRIDPEEFFDFQATRPTVRLVDGRSRSISWPQHTFAHARVDGRDIVLLTGPEPNLRWRTFSHTIVDTCRTIGASRLITLGAFLADVPHRHPVPVVGSASDPHDAAALGLSASNYEGPTGIIGVTHDVATRQGLPSVSFWAAVPHYLPLGDNPRAAVALAERLCAFLDITADLGRLERTTEVWQQAIEDQIANDDTLRRYVESVESGAEASAVDVDEAEADGDAIAAEIEQFLQGQGEP